MDSTTASLRAAILERPEVVLDDPEVMATLLRSDGRENGSVVDLRGALVERLQGKLGALEETHRSVLAAAYENVAGTLAVQRAVLSLLERQDFASFISALEADLSRELSVDAAVLVLEEKTPTEGLGAVPGIAALAPGGIALYRGDVEGTTPREMVLRACAPGSPVFPGDITSEALLTLDLGEGRRRAMLALGAQDPARFSPEQGTDLLRFFAEVFERVLRRWIG